MLTCAGIKACFEHSNFLMVTGAHTRRRVLGAWEARVQWHRLRSAQHGPPRNTTTGDLTTAMLDNSQGAKITAAAGIRLAHLSLLNEVCTLLPFHLQDTKCALQ